MKKTFTAAALLAALLLAGCSNSGTSGAGDSSSAAASENASLSAQEKAEKVLADIEFNGEMVAIDGENMELRLGFTSDGLTDYAALRPRKRPTRIIPLRKCTSSTTALLHRTEPPFITR